MVLITKIITKNIPTIEGKIIEETEKYVIYKLPYGYGITKKGNVGYWVTRLYTTLREVRR